MCFNVEHPPKYLGRSVGRCTPKQSCRFSSVCDQIPLFNNPSKVLHPSDQSVIIYRTHMQL